MVPACSRQLGALGRGAVTCLSLVNVHTGDHGFRLTPPLFSYAAVSSQVWYFRVPILCASVSPPQERALVFQCPDLQDSGSSLLQWPCHLPR